MEIRSWWGLGHLTYSTQNHSKWKKSLKFGKFRIWSFECLQSVVEHRLLVVGHLLLVVSKSCFFPTRKKPIKTESCINVRKEIFEMLRTHIPPTTCLGEGEGWDIVKGKLRIYYTKPRMILVKRSFLFDSNQTDNLFETMRNAWLQIRTVWHLPFTVSQASASAKLFLALHTAWGIPPIYIVTAAN